MSLNSSFFSPCSPSAQKSRHVSFLPCLRQPTSLSACSTGRSNSFSAQGTCHLTSSSSSRPSCVAKPLLAGVKSHLDNTLSSAGEADGMMAIGTLKDRETMRLADDQLVPGMMANLSATINERGENFDFRDIEIKEYHGSYEFLEEHDAFGDGAWSRVRPAVEQVSRRSSVAHVGNLPSPPLTPAMVGPSVDRSENILAIKVLVRKDAPEVIVNEGRILTFLHLSRDAQDYLVPFHGYVPTALALVFDALPITLDAYVLSAAETVDPNSALKMSVPIIGSETWKAFAVGMVSGLAFLHSLHCIHGDIKPQNILLKPVVCGLDTTYRPVYCDFSSSHVELPSSPPPPVSAITEDFASPELMFSFLTTNSAPIATYAADIFALGITLLVAATGASPYVNAKNHYQKIEMLKLARPLFFAREGSQGFRVAKGGLVTECVKGALRPLEGDVKRWTINEWLEVLSRT